jgi:arginine decarboxylase
LELKDLSQVGKKPTRFVLVSGTGAAVTELNAFDRALQQAGVGNYNLIRLSSILPPHVKQTDKKITLPHGDFVPIAYGTVAIRIPPTNNQVFISAAIAVGVPADATKAGLIMEHTRVSELYGVNEGIMKSAEQKFRDVHQFNTKAEVERMVERGMKDRGISDYTIVSDVVILSVSENLREQFGSAFAGVVLL